LFLEGRGIASSSYILRADLLGTVAPPPPVGQPITFGNIVEGTITSTSQVDSYRFTVPSDRLVTIDVLAGDFHVSWSLTGPAGKEIENRGFHISEGRNAPSPHVVRLEAGTYVVSIKSSGGHDDPYRFRLLDLDAAAPIALDATVTGEINQATETDVFRLNVTRPGRFFIDNQSTGLSGNDAVQFVLVDPQGFLVSSTLFLNSATSADVEVELKSAGTYTLLLEGEPNNQSPHSYQFTVSSVAAATPIALALGQGVNAAISQAGETDVYTFTLGQDAQIYFDAQTLDDNLRYTLSGPFGTIVNNQKFSALESIFQFGPPPNPSTP
jgi:hypothetical protein